MSGNMIIVEYTGEERDLVAKVARIEAQNNRLVEQLKKVGATGKQSGKSVYNAYDAMEKKAKDYERQLRNLEMSMERKGTATEKDTLRQSRLQKAITLTRGELEKVNAAHKNVTASVETHEKAEAKIESRYERSTRRIGEYRNKIRELTYDMQRKGVVTQEDATRLDRLNRALSTTQERMTRVDQATAGTNNQLAGAVSHVGKFVAAFTGIGSVVGGTMAVVQQLKAEYQHLVDQQRRAGNTQKSMSDSRAIAYKNMGDFKGGSKKLNEIIKNVSNEAGVPELDIWQAAPGLLSARGNLTEEQFTDALLESAKAYAISGLPIEQIGNGAMDVMKVTGGTASQSLGYLQQVGAQLRVTSTDKQIDTVIPIINAAKAYDFSVEDASALTSAITQLSGDNTGERSATAAVTLMQAFAQEDLIPYYEKGKRGKENIKYRGLKNKGIAGLNEVQDWYANASPELRKDFEKNLPGERKPKAAIKNIISRDPLAMKTYDYAKKNIGSPVAMDAATPWEDWKKEVTSGEYYPVKAVSNIGATGTQNFQLKNKKAILGEVRTQLKNIINDMPGGDFEVKKELIKFEKAAIWENEDALPLMKKVILDIAHKYTSDKPYVKLHGAEHANYPMEFLNQLPPDVEAHEGGWFQSLMRGNFASDDFWTKSGNIPLINDTYYARNKYYGAGIQENAGEIVKKIDELITLTKQNQTNKQPQPVKIVGDTSRAPNLHANREGGL